MKTTTCNKGFTLLEILIALVVSSILMAGIYQIFSSQIRVSTIQEQVAQVQQNIRSAMYIMEKEIRMAGYAGTSTGNSTQAIGFDVATATSMEFRYLTDSNAGTNDQTRIQYALADPDGDGDNDLVRTNLDTNVDSIIAENIEEIEFFYRFSDVAGNPAQGVPANDDERFRINSVVVTILARSSKVIPGSRTGEEYTTPSGAVWGNTTVVGTDNIFEDYNDGRYRRYMTADIVCRNL